MAALPRVHVFGHIHEENGRMDVKDEESGKTITFINAALANDGMVSKVLDKRAHVIDICMDPHIVLDKRARGHT